MADVQGDSCKHVSTSEVEPEEKRGEWAKYTINLSRFDALEQTHEGEGDVRHVCLLL